MKNLSRVPVPPPEILIAVAAFSAVAGGLAGVAFGAAAGVMMALVFGVAQVVMWSMWSPEADAPSAAEDKVLDLMERSNERSRISIRDESTGLLNRWYLERRLEEEPPRCKRYGYSMAVVVLKAGIKNLQGISADGWQVESATAAHRCEQVVRNVDLSASLAPFEFAICLVHCDREGAERAIERLISELSEYECSAGVAVFPEDDCAARAMIELARVRSRRVHSEPIGA
jgi:GGDEF domain-containing protein